MFFLTHGVHTKITLLNRDHHLTVLSVYALTGKQLSHVVKYQHKEHIIHILQEKSAQQTADVSNSNL